MTDLTEKMKKIVKEHIDTERATFDEDDIPEGICRVCNNIIQDQSINGCCVECY